MPNAVGRLVKVRYEPDDRRLEIEGRAFRLVGGRAGVFRLMRLDGKGDRQEPAGYCVQLAAAGGWDQCECKGFYRWGRCSHLAAVRAAVGNGWLIG